jgi:hypothetical protein
MKTSATIQPSTPVVTAAALATIAFGAALVLGWQPGLPGEWIWRRNILPVRLFPPLLSGLGLTALAALIARAEWSSLSRPTRALVLLLLILVTFAFQFALLNSVGPAWVTPGAYIVSPAATTYFAVSLDVTDPARWIADYPRLLHALPYHAGTHPPGFVLFFLAIRRVCAAIIDTPSPYLDQLARQYNDVFGLGLRGPDAAAAIASALVIALLGALAILPIYYLARLLVGPRAAPYAACLSASIPALLLLAASPDLIILSLTALALCLGYCAWRRRSLPLAFVAGLTVALGLFLSLAFALVAALAAIWLILGLFGPSPRREAVARAAAIGGAAFAGLLAFYLALYVIYGYRPIEVAFQALQAHRAVTTVEAARTYWAWVLMNPVECALFAGLPLVIAAAWSWRVCADPSQARLRLFLWAWFLLFVALDLSGTVRGEVGRIWLFLLWPISLAASAWLAARPGRAQALPLLVFLQVAQALLMKAYLTMYSIL